jgi:hypothetical protein
MCPVGCIDLAAYNTKALNVAKIEFLTITKDIFWAVPAVLSYCLEDTEELQGTGN